MLYPYVFNQNQKLSEDQYFSYRLQLHSLSTSETTEIPVLLFLKLLQF